MSAVIWPGAGATRERLGGKGAALDALSRGGFDVPAWFAIAADVNDGWERDTRAALARLAPGGERVAVRSSAPAEDGTERSYAGQLESWLDVAHADVIARVRSVHSSANGAGLTAYRAAVGDTTPAQRPAVLVQRMVHATAAGVAFSADPATGQRGIVVIAAVRGLGDALVSGKTAGDSYRVRRDGSVYEAILADADNGPVLTDAEIRAVAELARRVERYAALPQDIEWALENGRLHLLQARPITSLRALPDPDAPAALWDNANIVESYSGITTPLTYSFARAAYERVYRQFLRIVGVDDSRIEENGDALRRMIGLVRGRVYYNLPSWYRALALLPGFRVNRGFMEQMMGVREGLPEDLRQELAASGRAGRWRDAIAAVRMVWRLVRENLGIRKTIERFRARLDHALAGNAVPLELMRPDELVSHYRTLERELLTRWDAPLLNDFYAMVHHGLLRRLSQRWLGPNGAELHNDLVASDGAIVSAEPVRHIREMAEIAASDPALASVLADGSPADAARAVRSNPALASRVGDYLARFGDRCVEELKLETTTLIDDPAPLYRAIGRTAQAGPAAATPRDADSGSIRDRAERSLDRALAGKPLRRWLFAHVLRQARARIRDRELLRLERTRVFGRVRRIVLELGRRYAALGLLDDPRDVFHLEMQEVLGVVEGTATMSDIRVLAQVRREEFERWRRSGAPAERFLTRGPVHVGHDHQGEQVASIGEDGDDVRRGQGCYPGIVRARVRVVRDPINAEPRAGEILVAERTDPGWVMLFPVAAGLLVERGSLLSHSAIVARELGIPAVVTISGLTSWLATGDEVEMDGRSGVVRRLKRAGHAS